MSWTEFGGVLVLLFLGSVIWQEIFATRRKTTHTKRADYPPGPKNQTADYVGGIDSTRSSSLVLLHFTAVDNLSGISSRGLLTLKSLSVLANVTESVVNDLVRYDKRISSTGAICLSIGHPNAAVFESYRQKYPGRKFVVLELSDYLLADKDGFVVCPTNAASSAVFRLWKGTPHLMSGHEALRELFAPRIMRQKNEGQTVEEFIRPLGLPRVMTTDPQAEILYQKSINRTRIVRIHVEDSSVQRQVEALLAEGNWSLEVCVTPSYFSMRPDSWEWRGYRTDTADFGKRVTERHGH